MSESAAARSTGLVALSDRNATPIFKRRISAVSNLIHTLILCLMYRACVNFVPPKGKKELGHSRLNAT